MSEMLKGIAGIMVFSGCLGLGFWYRTQLNGRIKSLRMLQGMLELLASQVRYGRAALPECCRHVSAQLGSPFDQAFRGVAERMQENTGATFAEVFRDHLEKPLQELPLKQEDRETFLQFASKTGYQDGQLQLRFMEQSKELMAGTVERLERESSEKCKVAVGLGAMGGLLLILVLW